MEATEIHHDPLLDETGTSSMVEPRPRRVQLQEDEIDLLDLLIVLAKRKRLILGVMVCSAVLAAIVSLLLPNRYTATTKILPPPQSQPDSTRPLDQPAGSTIGALVEIRATRLRPERASEV